MAAYPMYTEGKHWHKSTTPYSAMFQMRQQVPPKHWHPSILLHSDTFQHTLILMLTATKHQFSHSWLVFTLWFSVRSKPAEHNMTAAAAAQSFVSALVSSNSDKPQYCKTQTHLLEG